MLVFNYSQIIKSIDKYIIWYAKKISPHDYKDHAQDMRMFVFLNLNKFAISKAPISYFLYILVITAYRRCVFDRKKQELFENDFISIPNSAIYIDKFDLYDRFVSSIVDKLNNSQDIVIFWSIVYNKGEKNYLEISKMLNMDYSTFSSRMKRIRSIIQSILPSAS